MAQQFNVVWAINCMTHTSTGGPLAVAMVYDLAELETDEASFNVHDLLDGSSRPLCKLLRSAIEFIKSCSGRSDRVDTVLFTPGSIDKYSDWWVLLARPRVVFAKVRKLIRERISPVDGLCNNCHPSSRAMVALLVK